MRTPNQVTAPNCRQAWQFGCAALFGRCIRWQRPSPAATGEFWRWASPDGVRILRCITGLAALVAGGCSQPVTALTGQDYHAITNVIRGDTAEAILDIRLVRGSVMVDTGRERVVDHCYELERTRKGWRIVWKGT
jgi:hypothetical protein